MAERQSCQTWDFGRKCVCACVCWQEHTTTAACHFGLSTNGHLFWIKWSSPLPSALLCIYHVVYSKVIFNMRAPFSMCCSATNHRASDECDNTQSCRVFSPHLSLVISSQLRLRAGETLTLSQLCPFTPLVSDEGAAVTFLKCSVEICSLFHQPFLMTNSLFLGFFLCFFSISVTHLYNSYCSQNISKIPILSLSGGHRSLVQSIPEIQWPMGILGCLCFYTMLSL